MNSLPPSYDRFIPHRSTTMNGTGATLLSLDDNSLPPTAKRVKHLSGVLLGSAQPEKEPVLHYTSTPRIIHPYDPKPEPHSLQNLTPFTAKEVFDAPLLVDHFYHHPIAHSAITSCIAVAFKDGIHLMQMSERNTLFDVAAAELGEYIEPISVAFSPNGDSLTVCLSNEQVLIYTILFEGAKVRAVERRWASVPEEETHSSPIAIGDQWIHIGREGGMILSMQSSNPDNGYNMEGSDEDLIYCGLVLSPDQQTLVAGSNDGTLDIFDLQKQDLKIVHKVSDAAIKAISFSPCGKYFATGEANGDAQIRIWKIKDHSIEQLFEKKSGSQVTELFWTEGLLLSTHGDGYLRLFNINPNKTPMISDPVLRKVSPYSTPFAAFKNTEKDKTLIIGCPGGNVDREILKSWEIQPFEQTSVKKRKREQPSSMLSSIPLHR